MHAKQPVHMYTIGADKLNAGLEDRPTAMSLTTGQLQPCILSVDGTYVYATTPVCKPHVAQQGLFEYDCFFWQQS